MTLQTYTRRRPPPFERPAAVKGKGEGGGAERYLGGGQAEARERNGAHVEAARSVEPARTYAIVYFVMHEVMRFPEISWFDRGLRFCVFNGSLYKGLGPGLVTPIVSLRSTLSALRAVKMAVARLPSRTTSWNPLKTPPHYTLTGGSLFRRIHVK